MLDYAQPKINIVFHMKTTTNFEGEFLRNIKLQNYKILKQHFAKV